MRRRRGKSQSKKKEADVELSLLSAVIIIIRTTEKREWRIKQMPAITLREKSWIADELQEAKQEITIGN